LLTSGEEANGLEVVLAKSVHSRAVLKLFDHLKVAIGNSETQSMKRTFFCGLCAMLSLVACGQESRVEALKRCREMTPRAVRVEVGRQAGEWICIVTK
jgi:hypothetical protein